MLDRFLSGAAVLCALSSATQAALIVDAGDHTLLPNTPGQTIQIFVSGGDQVSNMNLAVIIGDGSDSPLEPDFTAVDILNGTIFAGNNTGTTGGVQSSQWIYAGTTTISGTVSGNGLIGTLTLDTTGLSSGVFDLVLDDPDFGPTDFGLVPVTLINGSLTIQAAGPSISLSASAENTNLADSTNPFKASGAGNEFVDVAGGAGAYLSEIDDLTSDAPLGSVAINDVADADRTLVLLYLGDTSDDATDDIAELIDALDQPAAKGSFYDIAGSGVSNSDPLYDEIQALIPTYGAFDALVSFDPTQNPANAFFNWDFSGHAVTLQSVAVVPEPASAFALLSAGVALGMRRKQR
jgi:hypothetical protein